MGVDWNNNSALLRIRIDTYVLSCNGFLSWRNIKREHLIICNVFINSGHLGDLQANGVGNNGSALVYGCIMIKAMVQVYSICFIDYFILIWTLITVCRMVSHPRSHQSLTHRGPIKMVAILQTLSNFLNVNARIPIEISKFVSKAQINNIPALVQIVAWRRPSDRRQCV